MSRTCENVYHRPVIPLVLGLIAGIGCGAQFPGYRWLALVLVVLLFSGTIIQLVRRRPVSFLPCLMFAALGYLAIQPWLWPRFSDDHVIHYTDNRHWDISGTVSDEPYRRADRCYFTLAVNKLSRSGTTLDVRGSLRVTALGKTVRVGKGDRLQLSSKIRRVRSFQNPGGFDYRRYLAYRGIWVRTFVPSQRLRITAGADPSGIQNLIRDTRRNVEALIDQLRPGDHQAVLKALLLGQKHQIDPELREQFNRIGIGHLLAISGLHVGIVATSAFFLFYYLLKFSPFLLRHGRVKQVAALLTLGPVCFYALLSGMSPSTQRAVIMVTVFMLGHVICRDQDVFNTLAVAALIILIANPPALFNVSFQLSFTAVLGILLGLTLVGRPAAESDPQRERFYPAGRIGVFFLVSVFALLATLPLVMHVFNRVSVISVVTNFFLVPVFAFWVVPAGLGAVLLSFLHPAPALWLFVLDGYVLEGTLVVVRWLATLPFAAVRTFTPSAFEIGCYYLLIGSLYAWWMVKRTDPAGRQQTTAPAGRTGRQSAVLTSGDWIRSRLPIGCCLLALVLLTADTVYWVHQRFWRNDLRVTAIDVGQGSANLLELPGGYCILIDGGGFSDNSVFDVGARVIAPLLWRRKIMTVELLILTHANSDHLNGLIYIAEHFQPRTIWTNGQAHPTVGYRQFMDVIDRYDIRHPPFAELRRKHSINGVTVQILYPPPDYLKRSIHQRWRSTNNNSIVVKLSYGSIAFLFPGDIMARAEKELGQIGAAAIRSQVLMAAHHGSRSSSTPGFIEAVSPEVVIVSCGRNNRFGMPHPVVVDRFEKLKARIYRTDYHGAVSMTSDGRTVMVSVQAAERERMPIDFLTTLK